MTAGSIPNLIEKEPLWTGNVTVRALRTLGITAQLGLAILVIRTFAFEGPAFSLMFTLATGGFVVHAMLPKDLRQPWFIALSLAGIGAILGASSALWVVALGLGLIGLCHLPIRWGARVGLVLGAGTALAWVRVSVVDAPLALGIWPVLGSMFMFRLIIYLHHLRHHPADASLGRALAYFFMLPNVVFPLFPVIDFKTFTATWYDQDAFATYQSGLRYIARGLVHLVVYRYVYHYVVRDPAELANLADLLTYVVSTFLIYVRVSGQFHLIVGILHLFGYRLPRANNLYFLATGFTEIWRRNNIYWKDFMMKLVYYPSFFRLRRAGQKVGLIGATVLVFVVTWLLHSYQVFWLRGDFPVTATDALFWGGIGVFMVVELLRETARPPGRTQPTRGWSLRRASLTVGFFLTFSVMWALWESESLGDFVSLWHLAGYYDTRTLVTVAIMLAAALAFAGWPWTVPGLDAAGPPRWWRRGDFQTVMICGGLLALAQPQLTGLLGEPVTRFAQSLQDPRLNARDAAAQHRGYYEQLNAVAGARAGAAEVVPPARPGDGLALRQTPLFVHESTLLGGALAPSMSIELRGALTTTNQWGMRDQEYSIEKPGGTVRVALLGPSDVMGTGVADGQTFDALLATRLNSAGDAGRPHEVLNFAVGSYSMLQQAEKLRQRVFRFEPDVVVVTYHPMTDARVAAQHLAQVARRGWEVPHSALRDILAEARVRTGMEQSNATRRLRPHGHRLVAWSLQDMQERIAAAGAIAILLVLDLPGQPSPRISPTLPLAERLGYKVVDIRDVFDGHDPLTLQIAAGDHHPNARGHRLIADRLHDELVHRLGVLQPGPP